MPTTDAAAARSLVLLIAETRAKFAVLHGADDLRVGSIRSDVDLVVSQAPREVIGQLRRLALPLGLHLICYWPYDIGGVSTFWAAKDASEGVHLDLIYDPQGRGNYGLRTAALLESAVTADGLPILAPEDELLYLLKKRWRKGQSNRVDLIVGDQVDHSPARLRRRATEVFAARERDPVVGILDGRTSPRSTRPRPRQVVRQIPRLAGRVVAPIGFWAELVGDSYCLEDARNIAERFDRILVRTAWGARPQGHMETALWVLTRVASTRLRPGLYVSKAVDCIGPRPDLRLDGDATVEQNSVEIVLAMEHRTLLGRGLGMRR